MQRIFNSILTLKDKCLMLTKSDITLLYFRWVFTILVLPTFYLISGGALNKNAFLKSLIILCMYNAFITVYILISEKKYLPDLIFYIDITVISFFSYLLGGVSSDIYLVIFFVICYYGMFTSVWRTVLISVYSLIIYTSSCTMYEFARKGSFLNCEIILREFFFLLMTYGISLLIVKFRKYDQMHKKEFKLARTDKLTGLLNRHYLDQKIKEEMERIDESGDLLNVLIFDLDNFKSFNDSYGHVWGDKLLSLFAEIIRQNIRKEDIPIRYGGEEFLVFVRNVDIKVAKDVGDRIR